MLWADDSKREVTVPAELKKVLGKDKKAKAVFDELAYSHQKEYAAWISEAKKEETRISRAEKAAKMLTSGKRLKG